MSDTKNDMLKNTIAVIFRRGPEKKDFHMLTFPVSIRIKNGVRFTADGKIFCAAADDNFYFFSLKLKTSGRA